MLVQSRKVGQQIVIGDGIQVAVLQVQGSTVKLGVTAPESVRVHRQEVQQRRSDRRNVKEAKAPP